MNDETPIYHDLLAALQRRAGRPSRTEWPAQDRNDSSGADVSGRQSLGRLTGSGTRSIRIDVPDGDSRANRRERTRDRASDALASASDHQRTHTF